MFTFTSVLTSLLSTLTFEFVLDKYVYNISQFRMLADVVVLVLKISFDLFGEFCQHLLFFNGSVHVFAFEVYHVVSKHYFCSC